MKPKISRRSSQQDIDDLCASFQRAIADVVFSRVRAGLMIFNRRYGKPTALVAAGGVAANEMIRQVLDMVAREAIGAACRAAAGTMHRQRRDDRVGRR